MEKSHFTLRKCLQAVHTLMGDVLISGVESRDVDG